MAKEDELAFLSSVIFLLSSVINCLLFLYIYLFSFLFIDCFLYVRIVSEFLRPFRLIIYVFVYLSLFICCFCSLYVQCLMSFLLCVKIYSIVV